MLEDNENIKSHLPFGAEYDSILEWFIKSNVKTFDEIAKNSTEWGNYNNQKDSPKKVTKTGSREEWCVNNIYDLAGNIDEWTQERKDDSECVSRGGIYCNSGYSYPVAYRDSDSTSSSYGNTGFRAALYIK